MKHLKLQLLVATAATSLIGGAAQAQVAYAPAQIYGNGASSIAFVLRQQFDCHGQDTQIGFQGGAAVSVDPFNYVPVSPTVANPAYNCGVKTVQPNLKDWYLSTGSGKGVDAWKNYDLTQQNASGGNPLDADPGTPGNQPFPSIQYAFSDSPLSAANITSYNTATTGARDKKKTGNPIQVPLYILPVAVAYDPVYGKVKNADGSITELKFRVKVPRPDGSGGLKLSKAAYCGIFNGTITNWNSPVLKTLNGNQSLRDTADPVADASWSVPIRLVGRSETSGTTSLWMRHLAAACAGKYTDGENRLPYDATVTVAGTAYTGAASTVNPTNSISGAFFVKGASPSITGAEAAGLYMVANGSDGVTQALDYLPAPTTTGQRVLNGKIGYVGTDYVLPAVTANATITDYGINSANLQVGTGTSYLAPTAANATAAFAGIFPPQSTLASGVYNRNATNGNRANPLDWVQSGNKTATIANPVKGYPIVGTTNILVYTCYADPAVRKALTHYLAEAAGKITKDSTGTTAASNIPAKLFNDPKIGVLAKSGIAPMPAGWLTAITETFLKKSVQKSQGAGDPAPVALGDQNLWIQDKIPTTAATYLEYNATTAKTGVKYNASCTPGLGA
jgi:ABC-type phosphate transport system substrate-binding protein